VHVFRVRDRSSSHAPGETRAPLEGLQPRPFETVLFRSGLSAFSDRKFASLVAGERRQFVLVGVKLDSACLATALDAHDRGVRVTLVDDTLSAAEEPPFSSEIVRGVLLATAGRFVQRTTLARMLRLMPAGEMLAAANDF
jgi:nicotinamidase-related amidase